MRDDWRNKQITITVDKNLTEINILLVIMN